jgi:hypothetical protein
MMLFEIVPDDLRRNSRKAAVMPGFPHSGLFNPSVDYQTGPTVRPLPCPNASG